MTLQALHTRCLDIIYEKLITGNDGYHTGCKIYTALTEINSSQHNCLGCQFMDLHDTIYNNFLSIDASRLTEKFYFQTYIFCLYQNVERIYEMFEIINPGEQNIHFTSFFHSNFKTVKLIKRWMNFIKHPKAFQLTHHPQYCFEYQAPEVIDGTVLDSASIEKYYQGGKRNKELTKLLMNKDDVVVVMPNLIEITEGFCIEFNIFVDFIVDNAFVASILKSTSTIENYFEEE